MERQAPRRLRVLIVLALGVLAALAPGRTFKNTEGKTIEAEIARATATTVTLRLRNERTATIPLSTLSKPDQAYVKEWLADRVPRLRFDPRVKRSNKDADYTSSYSGRTYRTYSRQMQTYETSVEVRCEETAKGLDESTMTYLLIGRSLSNANQYKILTVQTEDFSIEPGGTAVVPFRTVVNYYYDSNYSRSGYKCVGYVFFAHRNRETTTSGESPPRDAKSPTKRAPSSCADAAPAKTGRPSAGDGPLRTRQPAS